MDRTALREVLEKLRSFESMRWREIEGPTGSHGVSVGRLAAAAQERLLAIRQDDVEELFSLRITGVRRVWGIRDQHVLRVLWYDPRHEVCPSPRKHT